MFAPAPAPRSAAATVHRDKTSRCFVYAAMTRPVLPSRIGVQTRQTVYTRTHDCHSVRFVVCLAKRRAPNVCCMCAAPVHANTAKQCKGANVRETPDSKILQTQSIHHTDKAKCLSVAPLLSEHHQRFLLQLLTLGGASRAWEQSTTLKCPFACHHSVSSLAHTQTVFTSQRQSYFQMVCATQRRESTTCKQALQRALRVQHSLSTKDPALMCAAPAFCLAAHSCNAGPTALQLVPTIRAE